MMFKSLLTALFLLVGPLAIAQEPVHLVKFISFSCSICRASESMDEPIRAAVTERGGRFVVAPIPRGRNDMRERFYYALRDMGPNVELEVRQSMYRGAQDLGYPLNDAPQVLDWLQTDLHIDGIDWARTLEAVNGEGPAKSVGRAVRLALKAGLQVVPAYVLIQGDKVLATLDAKSATGGDLSSLREAVIAAVRNTKPISKD